MTRYKQQAVNILIKSNKNIDCKRLKSNWSKYKMAMACRLIHKLTTIKANRMVATVTQIADLMASFASKENSRNKSIT